MPAMADTNSFGIADPVDFRLLAGAYNGDVPVIVEALAAGAWVDVPSTQGWTPLMWLAMRGLVAFDPVTSARWLVAAGAEVNRFVPASAGGSGGDTPLTLACEAGEMDLVGFLLANHADPDPPDGAFPPLQACLPSEKAVRRLLAAGADPYRRFRGQTALERYVEGWGDPDYRDDAAFEIMVRLLGG
jgi:ankyrin repeat protein